MEGKHHLDGIGRHYCEDLGYFAAYGMILVLSCRISQFSSHFCFLSLLLSSIFFALPLVLSRICNHNQNGQLQKTLCLPLTLFVCFICFLVQRLDRGPVATFSPDGESNVCGATFHPGDHYTIAYASADHCKSRQSRSPQYMRVVEYEFCDSFYSFSFLPASLLFTSILPSP